MGICVYVGLGKNFVTDPSAAPPKQSGQLAGTTSCKILWALCLTRNEPITLLVLADRRITMKSNAVCNPARSGANGASKSLGRRCVLLPSGRRGGHVDGQKPTGLMRLIKGGIAVRERKLTATGPKPARLRSDALQPKPHPA